MFLLVPHYLRLQNSGEDVGVLHHYEHGERLGAGLLRKHYFSWGSQVGGNGRYGQSDLLLLLTINLQLQFRLVDDVEILNNP